MVRLPPALVENLPADVRFMEREVDCHGKIEVPWPYKTPTIKVENRAPDSSGGKSTSLLSAGREITGSVVRLPPALVENLPADMRFIEREVGCHG